MTSDTFQDISRHLYFEKVARVPKRHPCPRTRATYVPGLYSWSTLQFLQADELAGRGHLGQRPPAAGALGAQHEQRMGAARNQTSPRDRTGRAAVEVVSDPTGEHRPHLRLALR